MMTKNKKFYNNKNKVPSRHSLKNLVNMIRPNRLQKETDWEKDCGNEVWNFWNNPDDAIYDKL